MPEYDRREAVKMIVGGLASLGVINSASASPSKQIAVPTATKFQLNGSVPLIPDLARMMPEAPELLDQLGTEFSPIASELATQQAYWLGFNGWMTDRLSGPIMEGKVDVESLGKQAWAIYATSYWGGVELRENWGMPPVMQKMSKQMTPPFATFQQGIANKFAQLLEALNGGGEQCLQALPGFLRDGIVHITAYNAGVQVVKTEDPPVGQRRPHRPPRPCTVRINARHFMRVDYDDLTTPHYLKVWRSAFERAVTANPEAYEKAIVGNAGQKDLREIWKEGVAYGNQTWGGDSQDVWTDDYFNESLRWSSTLNFGLEVSALAAFVAVVNQDPEAAKLAVMAHALYVGATPGWGIGLLDITGKLPSVSFG